MVPVESYLNAGGEFASSFIIVCGIKCHFIIYAEIDKNAIPLSLIVSCVVIAGVVFFFSVAV